MKTHWLITCVLFLMHIEDIQGEVNVKLLDKPDEGRVSIRYNGTWTILRTQKSYRFYDPMMNAFVICRMLGFNKALTAYGLPNYSNYTSYPYELYCKGEETNINQCSHGDSNPSKFNYISYIKCGYFSQAEKDVQARLGKTSYGVVELKEVGGKWSRVCIANFMEPEWDIREATVICRMLGYKGALGLTLVYDPHYAGKNSILKKFHCRGDEKTIGECAYSTQYPYPCPPSGDYTAGAFCLQNDSSSSFEVRLRPSSRDEPNAGTVEIKYHGVWGTICPYDPFRTQKYDNICRRLGYIDADSSYPYIESFRTTVSFKYNLKCNSQGKCADDVNITMSSVNCHQGLFLKCRVGYPVRFSVISGCAPEAIVNQTGLTDREKSLITYYQVKIFVMSAYVPYSNFFIPSNLTNIKLGDGKMYGKDVNAPLRNGVKYRIEITIAHKEKNGRLVLGDDTPFKLFTKTLKCAPGPPDVPSRTVMLHNTIGTTITVTAMFMILV